MVLATARMVAKITSRPVNEVVSIILVSLPTATFVASLVKWAVVGGRENVPTGQSLSVNL